MPKVDQESVRTWDLDDLSRPIGAKRTCQTAAHHVTKNYVESILCLSVDHREVIYFNKKSCSKASKDHSISLALLEVLNNSWELK